MKILFLCLSAFSKTGGIEKFSKAFMKALSEINENIKVLSVYDDQPDERYIASADFKAFKKKRIKFLLNAVKEGNDSNLVFISHINLAAAGIIIKMLNKKSKLYLVAHGIEIWNEVNPFKKYFLEKCDYILAVSSYTKNRIMERHNFSENKIIVFPNTIDPFFKVPDKFEKPPYILEKLKINKNDIVLFTLGRLSAGEGRKGYDKVIAALNILKNKYDSIKYIIAGEYDEKEFFRINSIIKETGLTEIVLIIGFIKEEELPDYYLCSDIFIMPSSQEGFGIVFLEAMTCGLPVIAGSIDGSPDAIAMGTDSCIIDPHNLNEIQSAILELSRRKTDKNKQQELTIKKFGFDQFKKNLISVLNKNNY
jgi:glycosyltransferase involved in cell wall biosynthesis